MPPGSGAFTIYPESGKRRCEGNGVKPIKEAAIIHLVQAGWHPEYRWLVGERLRPGKMDAGFVASAGLVAFEWETGNISSSHRSLNKICLGLLTDVLKGGFLVVVDWIAEIDLVARHNRTIPVFSAIIQVGAWYVKPIITASPIHRKSFHKKVAVSASGKVIRKISILII
ncbi:MAG: hypothetical protein ACREFK_10460 [Stellaceae bacterium]